MKTYYIFIIISIFVASFIGCGNNSHEHDHIHHVNEYLHLTSYTPEFEVYVTASPLIAGEEAHVMAHITFLEDFKPMNQGRVTVKLNTGSETVSQTLESPTHEGIYEFEIIPAEAGTGILSFEIESYGTTTVVSMEPVEVHADIHEAEHEHAEAHSEGENIAASGNSVNFSKEQSWKIDFSTELVKEETIGQIIRSAGQIRNRPENVHVVSSSMGGVIQFTGSSLFAGTQVNSGQSLFTIDGSSMAENNLSVRIAEAESEYNRAKAEYERKELLAAERIASESELNQAMAEFKRAEANYNNLSRNFKAGSQQVSSPISGYINELLVKNGQFVNAGEPVMTISRNNRLIIQTELQSRYYDQLDNINSANFRILNSDKIFSLDKIAAGNILYSRSVDLNNPLITLTIQLDKGEDLLPGSMVDLYLKTDGNMSVITVPNESIVEEMGNYFVFVQQTPELFEKRPVLIGVNDGRRTEIKEGVLAGERVIAKGAVLVKLSQSAGAIDVHSGHVH